VETKRVIDLKTNNKNRSGLMYKNILEKLNFEMEEIKLFDSFAGIGALHQSLKELGVPVKLTGISEIDVDAIISYAAIHIDNFIKLPFEFPSDDEMKKYLMDRNIGYDFDKQKSSVPRMKKDKLKWCYKATILTNCMGDVSSLDFDKIPDSDLFNFSFPCTNVSVAGKQEGMQKEDGSITHSGLYIYGIEAIKAKKFKYIIPFVP
jgi:DNA (cytosine-5)-methyltransferase 1